MCSEKHIELQQFINALNTETLVNFWSNPDELSTEALTALSQARVAHEGIGWIRANRAATADILYGIYELRKANNDLNTQIAKNRCSPYLMILTVKVWASKLIFPTECPCRSQLEKDY